MRDGHLSDLTRDRRSVLHNARLGENPVIDPSRMGTSCSDHLG